MDTLISPTQKQMETHAYMLHTHTHTHMHDNADVPPNTDVRRLVHLEDLEQTVFRLMETLVGDGKEKYTALSYKYVPLHVKNWINPLKGRGR